MRAVVGGKDGDNNVAARQTTRDDNGGQRGEPDKVHYESED